MLMNQNILIISEIRGIFEEFFRRFLGFIPGFLEALIILIIGYVIGKLIGSLIKIFLQKVLGLDKWLEMKGLEDAIFGISISSFIASLVKWYIYFIFISSAITYLNIPTLSEFLDKFILYYPRIIAFATLILFGLIAGEWLREKILETNIVFKEAIGSGIKFLSVLITITIALQVLYIDVTPLIWIITILIGGFVLTLSIAVGIGLGLALKDELKPYVKEFMERIRKESDES